ncbi:TrbC/VirB2 family protein [Luteibacter aegosomatis]|nr:TrbC/VirB2 family protein [Luteibacter aegosomatis]UPG84670.1 TrbC/VirB2 family protein [Luteibacter aegosomatis]
MAQPSYNTTIDPSNAPLASKIAFALVTMALMLPAVAFGADSDGLGETGQKVCGFFQNINSLLNAASIVVVTIAVIFSGYQIAFAHKRIGDVAPALVGGVLIGAAAQVARMVVGGNGASTNGTTACTSSSGKDIGTGLIIDAITHVQHFLHLHV